MIGWLYLFCGIVTVVISNVLAKYSNGYENMKLGTASVLLCVLANICFGLAVKTLSLNIAYSVWVGFVASSMVIAGHYLFHEHITPLVGALMLIIVVCSAALVVVSKA